MSDRVMMKVFSVLKSRTSTAGFSGVIIVESSSTGVVISANAKTGCMIASTGFRSDLLVSHELVVQIRLIQRPDDAAVSG